MSTRRPKIVCLRQKMTPQQKVKLAGSLDLRHLSCERPCLTHYISAVNRAIPDIFSGVDSPPKSLQERQKSFVYVRKWRHSRRSNLLDRSIYDTYRAKDHVWLTISRPLIALSRIFFQRSIGHRNVYKVTENRWSKSENAATEESQTCGIARFPHLSKKLSPHRPPLERLNGCR